MLARPGQLKPKRASRADSKFLMLAGDVDTGKTNLRGQSRRQSCSVGDDVCTRRIIGFGIFIAPFLALAVFSNRKMRLKL